MYQRPVSLLKSATYIGLSFAGNWVVSNGESHHHAERRLTSIKGLSASEEIWRLIQALLVYAAAGPPSRGGNTTLQVRVYPVYRVLYLEQRVEKEFPADSRENGMFVLAIRVQVSLYQT
jgi:hypothetical protein